MRTGLCLTAVHLYYSFCDDNDERINDVFCKVGKKFDNAMNQFVKTVETIYVIQFKLFCECIFY